jgi:hypothetical protein
VRRNPKCAKTLVSLNKVIAEIYSPSSRGPAADGQVVTDHEHKEAIIQQSAWNG